MLFSKDASQGASIGLCLLPLPAGIATGKKGKYNVGNRRETYVYLPYLLYIVQSAPRCVAIQVLFGSGAAHGLKLNREFPSAESCSVVICRW